MYFARQERKHLCHGLLEDYTYTWCDTLRLRATVADASRCLHSGTRV